MFGALIFEKHARAIVNQTAAAERVRAILPEIEDRMQALPPASDRGTTADFVARSESLAAEITDSQIQDLFASVIAGEICRPGSFTLKTLETVRLLDPKVAALFQQVRNLAFDGDMVVGEGELMDAEGIGLDERLELQDAGLWDMDSVSRVVEPGGNTEWSYGDHWLRIENVGERDAWIDVIRFTRVGRELASVLPFEASPAYFKAVSTALATLLKGKCLVSWQKEGEQEWTAPET